MAIPGRQRDRDIIFDGAQYCNPGADGTRKEKKSLDLGRRYLRAGMTSAPRASGEVCATLVNDFQIKYSGGKSSSQMTVICAQSPPLRFVSLITTSLICTYFSPATFSETNLQRAYTIFQEFSLKKRNQFRNIFLYIVDTSKISQKLVTLRLKIV